MTNSFYLEAMMGCLLSFLCVLCCFCRIDSYVHEDSAHHPNYLQSLALLLGWA